MLDEDEFAAGPQHSSNTANCFRNAGNGAQRKRADHRVDCAIGQRIAFSRKIQKFDINGDPIKAGATKSN